MKILHAPQGTTDWITQRLWRLTASELKTTITAGGKLSESKAAMKHIDKLIAGIELAAEMKDRRKEIDELNERQLKQFMAHYTGDSFSGSLHTERGHECEPEAIAALSQIVGSQIRDVGMCVMGDSEDGFVSCSPDGLEYAGGKLVAGAEMKSPCLFNYYNQLAEGVLPDEYKLQVHAGMAICEVDRWHFGSFFRGMPLFHLLVKRDTFTDQISKSLHEFVAAYQARFGVVMGKLQELERKQGREAA